MKFEAKGDSSFPASVADILVSLTFWFCYLLRDTLVIDLICIMVLHLKVFQVFQKASLMRWEIIPLNNMFPLSMAMFISASSKRMDFWQQKHRQSDKRFYEKVICLHSICIIKNCQIRISAAQEWGRQNSVLEEDWNSAINI